MSHAKIKQRPLHLGPRQKHEVRTQFGALCWRICKGQLQVLLVTSRGRGRWILPKGWPVDGETPGKAAATEAYEEGGVKGRTMEICLGIYSYTKSVAKSPKLPCVVAVFPIEVTKILGDWPEKGQRRRKWVSPRKAATMVESGELRRLIADFDPARLGS